MCGISGYFSVSANTSAQKTLEETLKKMSDSLVHRGPDAEGYYQDTHCGLAHRRLKIIDLSDKANQPMLHESSGAVLTFNGEIYNYRDLRSQLEVVGEFFKTSSDTEVLLKGLNLYGSDFIKQLEGDFAFAFWNPSQKLFLLCRDRFGIKPLYLARKDSQIYFASEIKALLKAQLTYEINYDKIADYFRYRYVPCTETLFKGIEHLPPGHFLKVHNSTESTECYFDITQLPSGSLNFKDSFADSVKNRLISDRSLGLLLSGGVDSSAIAAQVKAMNTHISTFSYSYSLPDEPDESWKAKALADHFGFDNLKITHSKISFLNYPRIIKSLEEPIGDAIIVVNDQLFEKTRSHVTVALSGEGADEIFSGYAHHRTFNLIKLIKKSSSLKSLIVWAIKLIPLSFLNKISFYPAKLNDSVKDRLVGSLESKDDYGVFKNLASLFSEEELKLLLQNHYREDISFFKNSLQITDFKNWLPKYGLLRVDKLSMAHSLEVRLPFLSHHVVESVWASKWTKPTSWGFDKFCFRDFSSRILMLPKNWAWQKKFPFFAPSEKIFSPEYDAYLKETLASERLKKFNILNPDFVASLLDKKNSDFLTSKKITSILIFHIWCEEFFKSTLENV